MNDLISREAMLEEFRRICGPATGDGWDNFGVRNLIMRQPTIDAEPVRHGRWVKEEDRYYHWHCSECGSVWGQACIGMKYCPNCGAKMEWEK